VRASSAAGAPPMRMRQRARCRLSHRARDRARGGRGCGGWRFGSEKRFWAFLDASRAARRRGRVFTRSARALPGSPHSSYSARREQREWAGRAGDEACQTPTPRSQRGVARRSGVRIAARRVLRACFLGSTRWRAAPAACWCVSVAAVARAWSKPRFVAVSCACARVCTAARRACRAAGGPR
jgi:hypothetical protein